MRSVSRPPPKLRAQRLNFDDQELVVFSYPVDAGLDGGPFAKLTPAQRQVAALVLRGLSNVEIAASRGTSVGTVAKQIETIYRRLEVHSRSDLAALAARTGPGPRLR